MLQDGIGHAVDGEIGGDGACIGGEVIVEGVVGEDSLELFGEAGGVP